MFDRLVDLTYEPTEDQQAIEDEGIIIPMKPTMPHSSMNNPYNRNQSHYFQPQQPSPFVRAPLYTTNVTNNPIAMMNYYNANPLQQAIQNDQGNQLYGNNNLSQFKQQNPIDVVSFQFTLTKFRLKLNENDSRIYHRRGCQS